MDNGGGWWNIDGWPLPEEWSAWWAGATFIVTLVAATIALLQFGGYIREREERARPYVQVDFEFRSVLLYVAVTNTSSSPATQVALTSTAPFRSSIANREPVFARIFSDDFRIAQLTPGRSISWMLDRAPDYYANITFPRSYLVTVSYNDPRATRRRFAWQFWIAKLPRSYSETFELDIEQWGEASAEQDYENQNWNINKRNEDVLKRAGADLKLIRQYLAPSTARPPVPIRTTRIRFTGRK